MLPKFRHMYLFINSKGKAGRSGLFRVKETIGMAIVNPRGIAKGLKSIIIGK